MNSFSRIIQNAFQSDGDLLYDNKSNTIDGSSIFKNSELVTDI